jgi:hypothetical protein
MKSSKVAYSFKLYLPPVEFLRTEKRPDIGPTNYGKGAQEGGGNFFQGEVTKMWVRLSDVRIKVEPGTSQARGKAANHSFTLCCFHPAALKTI